MAKTPIRISPDLAMPLDAVTETFGIFGQKGTGKSSTSALFVEQGVAAGGRFVIADPTGVWWGLMHAGAGPGLPGIVFGGEHADVPLESTAGHVVAEFVVQQDAYQVVVLDMKLMRKAERTRFMRAFLETLYHDNREALHVVLDEAHQFAPTQAREGGDTIPLLGAVEDVVALGRSRGLGITMISQRFATLNANVREQIGTLIAHRLIGNLDRKALKGWIDANADPAREKEVLDVQAKLKTAHALVWSPAFLDFFGVVHMAAPQTFDSRATPKVGQRVKQPGKRAQVDLGVLRERMAATIEEAEANDPKKLKAKLVEVERERERLLRDAPVFRETIRALEDELQTLREQTVEVPAVSEEQLQALHEFTLNFEHVQTGIDDLLDQMRRLLDPLSYNVKTALEQRDRVKTRPADPPRVRETTQRQPPPARTGASGRGSRSAPEAAPEPGASGGASYNGDLGASARHFLITMARFYPLPLTLGQLGMLAVRKTRGGSFNTAMRQLKDGGYVEDTGGTLKLSERGVDEAGVTPEPMTLDRWREVLPVAAREVLDVLVEAYPDWLSATDVGVRAGRQPRGGSWNTAIKMLTQGEIIEKDGSNLRLSDTYR